MISKTSAGLYNTEEFKDNCGFGLIAHIHGEASHRLLETAIEALTCMTHRGGIAADGKTGDGCGLLMQKPDSFLRTIARELNIDLRKDYAVGSIMLSLDDQERALQKSIIEQVINDLGIALLGWREVPVNPDCLGSIAAKSLPHFEHLFISNNAISLEQFKAQLFVLRRKIERKAIDSSVKESLYITSLSTGTIVYKGLMMPADLPNFFLDLADERLETAICVFHQRFSTNTLPKWQLAQPFRMLAHNGEINTIVGNRNWSVGRTNAMSSDHINHSIYSIDEITPIVNHHGSDSSSLDNMLEYMAVGGVNMHRAIRMLVPPAWKNIPSISATRKAFYEYNAMYMEPWDGPAGLVMSDGRYAVCTLDRNGLRPSRWVQTNDDFITVASEVGVYSYHPKDVIAKGRLGPGDILSIDTELGIVRNTEEIDNWLSRQKPYTDWIKNNSQRIKGQMDDLEKHNIMDKFALRRILKQFLVTQEEYVQIIAPMAEMGQEATGSMGDDIPMAVLSRQNRSPYDYFRQQFAQVTNPPIDPLRESLVMSLETMFGAEMNMFREDTEIPQRIIINSPVLSQAKYQELLSLESSQQLNIVKLELNYNPGQYHLKSYIEHLCDKAIEAVSNDSRILVLSDKNISKNSIPAHALFALGAIHQRLIDEGLRFKTNIIVETATARDPHHFACLLGYGATAVLPYLSYQIIDNLIESNELSVSQAVALINYRKAINKGLLKILSKMGISTIASYRGAQLFEAIGINEEVMSLCFKATVSRIKGASFEDFELQFKALHKEAWMDRKDIAPGGLLKYVHGQEYHAYNPDVVFAMHDAVQQSSYHSWKHYAQLVNKRPVATLRDLLKVKLAAKPLPMEQVESIEAIIKRFDSAGMSLGALSPEAHEALAEAMNTLKGRSNSGEGGEDPARYGTAKNSAIKQVASGRFGVTAHYLSSAKVIQIKMAQGAKPGEGGQLPGGKVNALIASLRYSVPGVTLISPPPHHDIYSIEDLAQLIFDLKQVNPRALISVKLVARPGVGTIATGVAKAYADLITISGYDGGTAASPLTSIRYAGSPWELGLSETHQMLCANDLRDKVRVQTDGGLKSGLDVIKAAILGAESFGFGTGPMIALGCKYLRICHLNNCATGVATQNEELRLEHYKGTVQMAINYFTYMATETREWLSLLGVPSLQDLIGRVDLLEAMENVMDGKLTPKQQAVDLSAVIHTDELLASKPQYCQVESNEPFDKAVLGTKILLDAQPCIEQGKPASLSYTITNCDRSIGASLSGEIAFNRGARGMLDSPIEIKFKGIAGQSFGVWNAPGLILSLEGDANDYVGKGMSGGRITVTPDRESKLISRETNIIGNTCLYGATGGVLYAVGRAGERFAVRNSGAMAVIEGAGAHCCEYMTGGIVVVLGSVGVNFGAGMTGGVAYVYDKEKTFPDNFNSELIEIRRISTEAHESYNNHLCKMLDEYIQHTQSKWGAELLNNIDDYIGDFWLVTPKAANISTLLKQTIAQSE